MDSVSFLRHLDQELGAFRSCLGADLTTPVEHCGAWTLHDLAEHLGQSNLWVAAAVTEGHGDFRAPAAPRGRDLLVPWFDGGVMTLLDALDADPATPAWTVQPPHTVGFWQRRRCLETLVHRWDAEHSLGTPAPLDAELADEGVAEVFDTIAPRQIARGRARPPRYAVRLDATDTGGSWTYGPGDPVAGVTASAQDLLLMLWRRLPSDAGAFTWDGDRVAGRRLLNDPLVA
ncbi:maleylpyruvate isomerase family mycothiol-dependent enzyme [Streptomyces odontomachi]|uniref:maleylpyruvate isomerase family mycothiol-dependent enzyme n=1 Tax=Streptomyces odontomachi TaxID=2944940 RepID=UPI00210DB23E|nr:maleylpyruvate isomerase family mycothiol-dependent enzyme [Streptomyces sp. ODS25]